MEASISAVIDDGPDTALPVTPVAVDLRALRTTPDRWPDRLRLAAALALSLGLHGAILLLLQPAREVAQVEEAIPIEMIFEPAPDDAPAPAPAEPDRATPDPQARQLDEKPATDFARTADQDREDGKAAEPAAAAPRQPEAAKAEDPAKDAPEPAPEFAAAPPPAATPALSFAGLTPLPDIQFKAPPARRSDLPSGGAPPGYMTTLYGRIMQKMPRMTDPARPARGRVTFGVMSNGRVFQEAITMPSGMPFLDAAALAAVRRAAPFPPPPGGGPLYIRFDYESD